MESQWLRDAIRLSLQASVSSLADDHRGPPEQRDPRFQKLAKGVLFTRRFVPTYNIVILAFVFLLSASHWTEKAARWRRTRAAKLRLGAETGDDEDAIAITGRYTDGIAPQTVVQLKELPALPENSSTKRLLFSTLASLFGISTPGDQYLLL